MTKKQLTFEEVVEAVMAHVTERHWEKNPPRGLAASIVLEASELLEHYQWSDTPVGNKDELAEELADIFIYAIQFMKSYDIDISAAIIKKLEKSALKYPAEIFNIKDEKVRNAEWLKAKRNFKKDTIL